MGSVEEKNEHQGCPHLAGVTCPEGAMGDMPNFADMLNVLGIFWSELQHTRHWPMAMLMDDAVLSFMGAGCAVVQSHAFLE